MSASVRTVLAVVLVGFVSILIWSMAAYNFDVPAIFEALVASPIGIAATADLVIALGLVSLGIYHDARAQDNNPWPWIVATMTLGSPGALVYLLVRPRREGSKGRLFASAGSTA